MCLWLANQIRAVPEIRAACLYDYGASDNRGKHWIKANRALFVGIDALQENVWHILRVGCSNVALYWW